jgi:hypothetical protein
MRSLIRCSSLFWLGIGPLVMRGLGGNEGPDGLDGLEGLEGVKAIRYLFKTSLVLLSIT